MHKPGSELEAIAMSAGGFAVDEIEFPFTENLSAIAKGLVMVFARWSPIPLHCLARMKSFLPPILKASGAKFYIIDNDKLSPQDMQRIFGRTLHGAAETFVLVGGQIRGEQTGCPDEYEQTVRNLCEKFMD